MLRFLLLLPVIFLWSCKVFKEPELVSFEKLEMAKSEKGVALKMGVKINNPNFYRMVLKKGQLTVNLNNSKIGDIQINDKIAFKAKSETLQQFELQAGLGNLIFALPGLLSNPKSVVTVDGKIKGRVFIFSKTYKIHWENPLNKN
jgi:LEA14-like dessication related protein